MRARVGRDVSQASEWRKRSEVGLGVRPCVLHPDLALGLDSPHVLEERGQATKELRRIPAGWR